MISCRHYHNSVWPSAEQYLNGLPVRTDVVLSLWVTGEDDCPATVLTVVDFVPAGNIVCPARKRTDNATRK